MAELQLLDNAISLGNLESYKQWAYRTPMLSEQEEQRYAKAWQDCGDVDSARKLVLAHLRFVIRVARGFGGYGLPQADLIQEGNIGLMKAVHRFNPTVGVRLVSFAVHWIKAEMHEYILRNWRIVKVATTKAQRKLFFNLRSAKKRLGWFTKEEVDAVASDLGVSSASVLEMEARLNAHDTPYDLDDGDDSGSSTRQAFSPSQYLEDRGADPALLLEADDGQANGREQLLSALQRLDERSQIIIQRRWLADKKTTLHELAAEFSVSAERIRQLEKSAMKVLRQHIDL